MCTRNKPLYLLCIILILTGTDTLLFPADLQEVPFINSDLEIRETTAPSEEHIAPVGPSTKGTPFPSDPTPEENISKVPDDSCLPGLYKDWQEFSLHEREKDPGTGIEKIKVLIDRSNFRLTLQLIRPDESSEEVYGSAVALGDQHSPTPKGSFVINHVYCYPDVVFFSSGSERIPALYNGFFAPLLFCVESGKCQRFQELGIHGFQAWAHPNSSIISPDTYGAVSGGCIRLPDPCAFKVELIRRVGIGPLKRNERGCYHWLNRPVEVLIQGSYPGMEDDEYTLISLLQKGLMQVHVGLKNFMEIFTR